MDLEKIGEYELKAFRINFGLKIKDLSRHFGLRRKVLKNWESGQVPIPIWVKMELIRLKDFSDEIFDELNTEIGCHLQDTEERKESGDITEFQILDDEDFRYEFNPCESYKSFERYNPNASEIDYKVYVSTISQFYISDNFQHIKFIKRTCEPPQKEA